MTYPIKQERRCWNCSRERVKRGTAELIPGGIFFFSIWMRGLMEAAELRFTEHRCCFTIKMHHFLQRRGWRMLFELKNHFLANVFRWMYSGFSGLHPDMHQLCGARPRCCILCPVAQLRMWCPSNRQAAPLFPRQRQHCLQPVHSGCGTGPM